jgi:hypothetical protein
LVAVTGDLERLAYEAALRALDKQERVLEELRARTGVLIAAASLATSFLGQAAIGNPAPVAWTSVALAAFALAVLAGVYVLAPRRDVVFGLVAPTVLHNLYELRHEASDIHRRLADELEGYRRDNDVAVVRVTRAYRLAAGGLLAEVLVLGLATLSSVYA